MSRVIIFDTETTGLLKPSSAPLEKQPKIIELGALAVNLSGVLGELSQLLDPEQEIDPKITKITGIKQEQLEGQPTFLEFYPRLKEFFAGADFMICHNAPFDHGMLQNELRRHGLLEDFPMPTPICTVQEYMCLFGRRAKMTEVYERLCGRPLAQTHRALDDVTALYEILLEDKLLEKLLS